MIIKAVVGQPAKSTQPQLSFKKAPPPAKSEMSGEEVQRIFHQKPPKPVPSRVTVGGPRAWRPTLSKEDWRTQQQQQQQSFRGGGVFIKALRQAPPQPRGRKR